MKNLEDASSFSPLRKHLIDFKSIEDREEFFNDYPAEQQDRVRDLWDRMMRIEGAANPHKGSKLVQGGGLKAKRLETLHAEWRKTHRDWRVLVNKRDFPDAREPRLPEAFRNFIREKFQPNQRKNAPAWRQIIRQWEKWLTLGDPRQAIPGYETCPRPGPQGRYPRGWSEKNLNRFRPPPAEQAMARIGVAAAMALLPKIPGTRAGVRWLEYVSGDDVWLNRKVVVPGYREPCRVVQFGMMDYGASFYPDCFIQRPVLPRQDGTTEQLKRRDFLWCVAIFLERYGFPTDYVMHIICERGTATLTRAEALFLYEISQGRIVVGWSTMEGEMVAAWEERKSGNSNAKGWHESFHNLYQNEEGDLPGQVGKDRDHSPAALLGSDRMAATISDLAAIAPAAHRAKFVFPYPDPAECLAQSIERVGWINNRKDHDCEGFQTVLEWRPRGLRCLPMLPSELDYWLEQNPRVDPRFIDAYVEYFPRPESPTERMHRLKEGHAFQFLPNQVWRRFYEDCHETRRILDTGAFTFQRVIEGVKRSFNFEPATPDDAIRPGTEVTGFFKPDGSAIHLFAPGDDRYLLTWPAVKAHRRGDAEGKALDFHRKRSFLNRTLGNVRADLLPQIEAAQDALRRNTAAMQEAGLLLDADASVADPDLSGVALAVANVTTQRVAETKASKAATARDQRKAAEAQKAAAAARAERARMLRQD